MSTHLSEAQARPIQLSVNGEARHRILVTLSAAAAVVLAGALAFYGRDYYVLDLAQRPLSAKHALLRPSGAVGLKLGMLGCFLFALVYLYPIRKRWSWLARQGKSEHWLNFHMLLGLVAPVAVTFHSALKIKGFAGMAFWTMIALAVSGLVGRYLYAQIPRTLDAATMTLKDMQEQSARLIDELRAQGVFDGSEVARLFRIPDAEQVRQMSLPRALARMAAFDLSRPLRVWSLRRRRAGAFGRLLTLGGILPVADHELERAISLVAREASLSKKIVFLSKAERVFYLWHVIHRPFSVSFAVFVMIHVSAVMLLGYF